MTVVEQAKQCMQKISGNWDYHSLDIDMKENGDTELVAIEFNKENSRFWAFSEDYVYFMVYWCPRWGDEYERIITSVPRRPGVTEPYMIIDES